MIPWQPVSSPRHFPPSLTTESREGYYHLCSSYSIGRHHGLERGEGGEVGGGRRRKGGGEGRRKGVGGVGEEK